MEEKEKLIVFTKSDLLSDEEKEELLSKKIKNYDGKTILISSVTQVGTSKLIDILWNLIEA